MLVGSTCVKEGGFDPSWFVHGSRGAAVCGLAMRWALGRMGPRRLTGTPLDSHHLGSAVWNNLCLRVLLIRRISRLEATPYSPGLSTTGAQLLLMSLKIDYMRPSQSAARSTLEPRSILEDLLARSRTIKRVVSLAADIANTAENVKANKRSCVRLASSVVDCVLKIDAVTKDRWDPAPRIIKLELDQVEFLLLSILNWMRDLVEAGLFSQLLKRSHIKHKTDELRVSLLDRVSALQDSIFEEIRRTINLNDCLQVVLAHNTGLVRRLRRFQRQGDAESQPGLLQKDGDGFPVIHRSEVVLRNPQRPGGSGWEGVTEASVGGRPVLVKHYDGPGAEQRWDQDVTFLKTVWDARLPQLYGISRGGDTPLFTILHDTGHTDLQAFVSPSIQAGQLLQVAATATRVAEHLRAGLAMLASSGRWPAIYGSPNERPSLALLSSLAVNNRGIVVIGANIASDRQDANHRGPLVWLCHEVFGSRYPGTALAIGEHGLLHPTTADAD
ncbi:hypothetical protein BC834DRAFT_489097 [Gloeopeniophorella convolvens]|nr:hypothetical protein BC834DRAFT_489097 [Gloeopeniophorella convolvens]